MIRLLKQLWSRGLTFLRYSSILKGNGVLIKNSQLAKADVAIFDHAVITGSVITAGTRIHSFAVITNTTLNGNKIGKYSTIAQSHIGKHSYVADFAAVNRVTIGKFCSVGPGFKCGLGTHPHNFISSSPFFYQEQAAGATAIYEEYADTVIGNDVWIGANVFVKDGLKIGNGVIIAAGAVVLKDVEPYTIVGGVPAKVLRYRHEAAVIQALEEMKWWDRDEQWLRDNRLFFQKEIVSIDDLKGIKV